MNHFASEDGTIVEISKSQTVKKPWQAPVVTTAALDKTETHTSGFTTDGVSMHLS